MAITEWAAMLRPLKPPFCRHLANGKVILPRMNTDDRSTSYFTRQRVSSPEIRSQTMVWLCGGGLVALPVGM